MSDVGSGGAAGGELGSLGNIAIPPFAVRPDPEALFLRRSDRFRALADGNPLKPYLIFLADLASAQHWIQQELPPVTAPGPEMLARARTHGMPPLDRQGFVPDAACTATLDRLLAVFADCEMPDPARAALGSVVAADPASRTVMMRAVLADAIPVEAIAGHVLVAAALQVHFARLAARLDTASLSALGDGVCPACGGRPVVSLIAERHGANAARYCVCALCSTQWSYVRIKCTACGSTKGISYQEIEGGGGTIKAETCSECGSYAKVLHHNKDTALDPVADDVATLGLDLLVRETGLRRASTNPFMLSF
ncbi:MAG: formate dehydrogenase accessory protein FdhE [Rhodoplanes sp.]|uniref:formate dehydrogenase accessory protein FdhE n=1 Tax=Rhodoplanes sp. TaxID=1968906 RepID=UPI001824CE88|nr:formate dehydrogenase accessory protein FdhE [Rhodoplanes sp.]NVO16604.1 formate dehydrogenase accessory protein FdhE [Rhodoplanes sp.]